MWFSWPNHRLHLFQTLLRFLWHTKTLEVATYCRLCLLGLRLLQSFCWGRYHFLFIITVLFIIEVFVRFLPTTMMQLIRNRFVCKWNSIRFPKSFVCLMTFQLCFLLLRSNFLLPFLFLYFSLWATLWCDLILFLQFRFNSLLV